MTRMEDTVRHANYRFRSRCQSLAIEESTLRWPTDKEHEEMEEVCSIGEVPLALTLTMFCVFGLG